jgi:hypothetical protein
VAEGIQNTQEMVYSRRIDRGLLHWKLSINLTKAQNTFNRDVSAQMKNRNTQNILTTQEQGWVEITGVGLALNGEF